MSVERYRSNTIVKGAGFVIAFGFFKSGFVYQNQANLHGNVFAVLYSLIETKLTNFQRFFLQKSNIFIRFPTYLINLVIHKMI